MAQNLLLISVDSPVLMGIYENCKLVKSFSAEGKFSDSLPRLFAEVLDFDAESSGNSSLGTPFALGGNFGEQQTQKSSFIPKISSKYKTSAANTRICDLDSMESQNLGENSEKIAESSLDSANSQNLNQKELCEAPENSPASWCKKSGEASSSGKADFLLEAEKRGSPPKSEKRQLLGTHFKKVGGSEVGGAALLREKNSNENTESREKSKLDSASRGISNIFYANGPGNFSAIKLTHIFLQTLSIAKNIPLFCADAFHFSNGEFINAYSKVHFYKEGGEIRTKTLSAKQQNHFSLPRVLDMSIFSDKCEPLYILPAV